MGRMRSVNKSNSVSNERKPNTRRQELKDLSNAVKLAAMFTKNEGLRINELLKIHYLSNGMTDLRTFEQWKEAGYTVKKGEKSVTVWSKPMNIDKKEDNPTGEKTEYSEVLKEDFFGICHLFDISQVEKKEVSKSNLSTN